MIYIPFVKFIPRFFSNEHRKESETDGNCKPTHRDEPRAEADGALEVYTEGHEHAVCAECTVNPAETECHADYYPCDEAEHRTVEYPFREITFPTT